MSAFDEIRRAYLAGRADGLHAAADTLAASLFVKTALDTDTAGMSSEAYARLSAVLVAMIRTAEAIRPRGTLRVGDPEVDLVEEVASWPVPITAGPARAEPESPAELVRDRRYRQSVASMIEGTHEKIARGVESVSAIVDVVEALVGSGTKGKGGSHE